MSSSTPVWMQFHHKSFGLCVMHKASCRWVRCRVGIALLKGQWEEAVRLIMQPSSHERADSEAAKKLYLDQGDILGALKAIPRHCVAESAILQVCRGQQGCMYVSWSSEHMMPKTASAVQSHVGRMLCGRVSMSFDTQSLVHAHLCDQGLHYPTCKSFHVMLQSV